MKGWEKYGGTVMRGLPYNIFLDVDDARECAEKMVHSSQMEPHSRFLASRWRRNTGA